EALGNGAIVPDGDRAGFGGSFECQEFHAREATPEDGRTGYARRRRSRTRDVPPRRSAWAVAGDRQIERRSRLQAVADLTELHRAGRTLQAGSAEHAHHVGVWPLVEARIEHVAVARARLDCRQVHAAVVEPAEPGDLPAGVQPAGVHVFQDLRRAAVARRTAHADPDVIDVVAIL